MGPERPMPFAQFRQALIVGGDSMVGCVLARSLAAQGKNVKVTTRLRDTAHEKRLYLDLGPPPWNLTSLPKADVWFLCIAVTRIKICEANPEGSRRVNVEAMTALARAGVETGARVLFLSSDKVFDGTVSTRPASDDTCPVTVYGQQKAEAEQNILGLGNRTGVVRFAKILDGNSALFKGWIESLSKGEKIEAFADLVMAPVPLNLAVDILTAAADKGLKGILQVSGPRDVTYADAARHIARRLGVSLTLVKETSAREAGFPREQIPPHSTMDTRQLKTDFGILIPDALEVLDDLYGLNRP